MYVQMQIYLKAHFTYDPKRDSLIPCREAGLPFRAGEILEVVNRDDVNWWQVGDSADFEIIRFRSPPRRTFRLEGGYAFGRVCVSV